VSDEAFYVPTGLVCPLCQGERWVCEEHTDRPWPHGDCPGPGVPCPICNTEEPPRTPPGFVSHRGDHD
jgi:hypothetical protein